ncbi:hypothetical protein [Thiolinea disciformis]|uniref:hypothetical protein n=1 Tax=Thiolinea disciformis TaxID=125614 RepID=UPI00035EA82D|nr:hypothetical protein [Thiolinea disciformis]
MYYKHILFILFLMFHSSKSIAYPCDEHFDLTYDPISIQTCSNSKKYILIQKNYRLKESDYKKLLDKQCTHFVIDSGSRYLPVTLDLNGVTIDHEDMDNAPYATIILKGDRSSVVSCKKVNNAIQNGSIKNAYHAIRLRANMPPSALEHHLYKNTFSILDEENIIDPVKRS